MKNKPFNYKVEHFADIKVLRYRIDGFEKLTLRQKCYSYYLGKAALCGRDILWDQNNRYNLRIRAVLETIYTTYSGDRSTLQFIKFVTYLKRIWFSNGIHHHYSTDKFAPDFSIEYFHSLVAASAWPHFPGGDRNAAATIEQISPVIFDPSIEAKRVSLNPDNDLILQSANNYYFGVTQAEAEGFYKKNKEQWPNDETPSFGLNSRLEKTNNEITENVWKEDGRYGNAISKIIFWLEKACPYAENASQLKAIQYLIEYYRTGNLQTFDQYSILWVQEREGTIDFVNGFIEVYGDALGIKGSWESLVNFKDFEATRRSEIISQNAQWFEDNSPVDKRFKKEKVKGVTAKAISATMLGGDCYPATPIGINLPNAEWIREKFGSKSVTIGNITKAYHEAAKGDGFLEEFAWNDDEINRNRQFGFLGNELHTDLHECLGHGSGKLLPGVNAEALKNYHSTIEETRADLFALYYIADSKMVELGLVPSDEVAKTEYDNYIRNGLMTQLVRIESGKDIEESHMRNRQLIAYWVFEKGAAQKVIGMQKREGKSYVAINDYKALRELFAQLLAEVQRIKSEGDFEAGKQLVERYGVKVDPNLHAEVLERYTKLQIAPYSGFLNPEYTLQIENGEVTDVLVEYSGDFASQQLQYSREYSFLPLEN